jgi:hypothetical protein
MVEAAKLLGIKAPDSKQAGAACRRYLAAIEKERSIQLIFRRSATRVYTTDVALKNVLPELFEEDRFMAASVQNLKETVAKLKDTVANLNTRLLSLSAELKDIKSNQSK